ncbi:GDSL esterase/lipase At1g28570-like [Phoenix dactylifera]|uniref:GDSL esterase/lipase At1g28570-like n=1 Tax=Phoenix dactylifera TaxID=42345 RepID=A0A8B8ZMK9_PHODC|nr:GDSL esterase/lipase At1g28570-like [Phoenix dactylifera]
MASSTFHLLLQLSLLLALLFLQNVHPAATSCYTSIFSFGDSLADTGNFLHYANQGPEARLPYGETYFQHPTGRFSDGRLIIDFIAQAIGVPLVPPLLITSRVRPISLILPSRIKGVSTSLRVSYGIHSVTDHVVVMWVKTQQPYLAGPGDHGFRRGANFAVGGATALDNDFFRARGLDVYWTDYSLATQIDWFKKLLPSLCSSDSECEGIFSSSLFFMGEIGGNDYNEPFIQGISVDEIRTFVPDVISTITSTLKVLIELGAKTLVVPGNFPIGCVPLYLMHFQSPTAEDYDPETGCIKWLNEFSEYHNRLLLDELGKLRRLYPHVAIVYADYYEALLSIFRSPHEFGFEKPFDACCGGGSVHGCCSIPCGDEGAAVCSDPSKHISWDGVHLTEAAYKAIARGLLEGPYTAPPMIQACPHAEQHAALLRNASIRPPAQAYSASV